MAESLPFGVFTQRLLSLYQEPLRAPSTLQRMSQLTSLLAASGFASTADLTTSAIAAWIVERSKVVSPNTVVGELGYIRALCEFAVEEGLLDRNPFSSRRLKVRPVPPGRKSHHSIAEIGRVLDFLAAGAITWSGHRLYALAATVAYTGLRRNEALYLKPVDVRLTEGLLLVVARRRLKTVASAAPVPICAELTAILEPWLVSCGPEWCFPTFGRDRPWTGGGPGYKPLDRLRAAGLAAGVDGLTFQSLRHSLATHLETAFGVSEGAIRRILRHTSDQTSLGYRHADAENLRRLAGSISYRPTG